jgi:hypothetical protein
VERRTTAAAAAALLLLAIVPSPARAIPGLWGTNGKVHAVVESDGILYLGGNFTQILLPTGSLVQLDLVDGEHSPAFPSAIGDIYCIVPDGAGGWYVGGSFTHIGGLPRRNLAHVHPDFTVDDWNPSPDNSVDHVVVHGSTVYVAGDFFNIAGVARSRLAAFDAATGLVTAWDPSPDHDVEALAADGGTVYVGGRFANVGGAPRDFLAALDGATGAATAWNPDPNSTVHSIAVMGPNVYAGGAFSAIDGQSRSHLAALDAATGAPTSWDPGADGTVHLLVPNESSLYVVGYFDTIGTNASPRTRIAEIDRTTGTATTWNPGVFAYAVARRGTVVYLGGSFTGIGSTARRGLAAVDATFGTLVQPWNPRAYDWGPNGTAVCRAIAVAESSVVAGGSFVCAGETAVSRSHLAAIDLATGLPTAWNPSANDIVLDLELSGNGTLYAGGLFSSVGAQSRDLLAEIDLATGAPTGWAPPFVGSDVTAVHAVARSGNTVYAGGKFVIGGATGVSHNLAAFDAVTGSPVPSTLPQVKPSRVRALLVEGSALYLGGDFTTVGGLPRSRLASLDRTTGAVTSWDPDVTGVSWPTPAVEALVSDGSTLFVGGSFTAVGGQSRLGLAALDLPTGAATGWDPQGDAFVVNALALDGSTLYAGGLFGSLGGQTRVNFAGLDVTTAAATSWAPVPNTTIFNSFAETNALAVSGSSIYAGGTFIGIDGVPATGVFASSPGATDAPDIAKESTGALRLACSPNPFRSATTIRFTLPEAARVRLEVFDVTGRRLDVPVRDVWMEAGTHSLSYRGGDLPAGVYFYRVQAGEREESDRLLIVR